MNSQCKEATAIVKNEIYKEWDKYEIRRTRTEGNKRGHHNIMHRRLAISSIVEHPDAHFINKFKFSLGCKQCQINTIVW